MSLRYRKSSRPASRPGRFGQSRGLPPGSLHQGIELLHPYRFVGARRAEDRFGWRAADDLTAFIRVDWADGDGVNPAVGPTWTQAGVVTAGEPTPWQQRADLSNVTASRFLATSDYRTATPLDPGLTDDFVIAALIRNDINIGQTMVAATRTNAQGWRLYISGASLRLYIRDTLGVWAQVLSDIGTGWALFSMSFDESGLARMYLNGHPVDTVDVTPLGNIASGLGLGLTATPTGGQRWNGSVARFMYWIGAAIADLTPDAWHLDLANDALGTLADQGADGTHDRNTMASWQNTSGVWHLGGIRMSRAGDDDGIRLAPARTNQAFKNCQIVAGDAAAVLTATGGVVSEVDDSAALLAADAQEWGDDVYQFANATGAVQYVRMSQQTGNVNARSLQCLVRRSAGAGAVNLGLYDESAGTFVAGAAINDGYGTRTLVHGQVPTDVDCTLCLEVADNTTIRFIAQGMETGPTCTTPVPNLAVAAAAARNADDFVTSDTPADETGGVSLSVTPLSWSGADTGGASLLWTTAGAQSTLFVTAAGVWELQLDGTTTITSTAGPAADVWQDISIRWAAGGLMTLTIDGEQWSAAYDGTIRWGGTWQLFAQQGEFAVRDFTTYRNGSG